MGDRGNVIRADRSSYVAEEGSLFAEDVVPSLYYLPPLFFEPFSLTDLIPQLLSIPPLHLLASLTRPRAFHFKNRFKFSVLLQYFIMKELTVVPPYPCYRTD